MSFLERSFFVEQKNTKAGFWDSPIDPSILQKHDPLIDGQLQICENIMYFVRSHPKENGRVNIVALKHGEEELLLPEGYSARSKVNEYGGACYCVHKDIVYFVDHRSQNIYMIEKESITLFFEASGAAFGELIYDHTRNCVIAVEEKNHKHTIVALFSNKTRKILQEGADFYASPRLNMRGNKLAFISWNFPYMPWDHSILSISELDDDGRVLQTKELVNSNDVSVFQPEFYKEKLYYIRDNEEKFWQLYCYDETRHHHTAITKNKKIEYGLPLWQLGMKSYAISKKEDIMIMGSDQGAWKVFYYPCHVIQDLACFSDENSNFEITSHFSEFSQPAFDEEKPYIMAANEATSFNLYAINNGCHFVEVLQAKNIVQDTMISFPRILTMVNDHHEKIYANYYAPHHHHHTLAHGEKPPLIVRCHGGPSAQASRYFQLKIQFWTSRGFSVVDINYRGSTGFGRAYRESLYGEWGVKDIEDVATTCGYLCQEGLVDPDNMFITGSSAGGYTVLACLAFLDIFKGGTSAYGIGDLSLLHADTHKFESRYLEKLIGKWPEDKEIYQQRSPCYHVDKIQSPILFLQGDEDAIVPMNQAIEMSKELDKNSIENEVVLFKGEGHGFRKYENIKYAFEKELAFYQKCMKKIKND